MQTAFEAGLGFLEFTAREWLAAIFVTGRRAHSTIDRFKAIRSRQRDHDGKKTSEAWINDERAAHSSYSGSLASWIVGRMHTSRGGWTALRLLSPEVTQSFHGGINQIRSNERRRADRSLIACRAAWDDVHQCQEPQG